LAQSVPEADFGFARLNGTSIDAEWPFGARKVEISKEREKVSGNLRMNQGVEMNSRLILAAGAAWLFAVAGMAHAQGAPQGAQPPTQSSQPAMQQNAEAPAQPGTDTSYGGVPATRSAAAGIGGVPDATRSDAGSPIGKTRQQVYQEYLRARQSGELDQLHYRGR
jgi:hypothetical protein